jgi:leucyl/phenylalanyl-tRNA--protein transferase
LANNASKVALVHLVERLNEAGYQLLDTQYVNDHLKQFGIIEITRDDYLEKLQYALKVSPNPSSRFATVSPSIS